MTETCVECGFDAARWLDGDVVTQLAELPDRFRDALVGLSAAQMGQRVRHDRWSIAEYVDHVREVLFGMRFLLATAIASPGTDLGASPPSTFAEHPRDVDVAVAMNGLRTEARALVAELGSVTRAQAESTVTFDGHDVDAFWISRHALHDATHHLGDVMDLRGQL